MKVKFQVKLDELSKEKDNINIILSGSQLFEIDIQDEDIVEEYKSKDETEQCQVITLLLEDYIKAYADFVDVLLGEGEIDRELIEDSISSGIKEE